MGELWEEGNDELVPRIYCGEDCFACQPDVQKYVRLPIYVECSVSTVGTRVMTMVSVK